MNWVYQPHPELYDTLRDAIRSHHDYFIRGFRDKSTMPLYLFLCGDGTGRSRNAQEFHQSLVSCLAEEDKELKDKIEKAWVFHVSLENCTSPEITEPDPIKAIGIRKLSQHLPDKALHEVMWN
jgi:hypothetical protein